MIDFYRKSILSQLGKDAGNQSTPDFIRNIIKNYDKYSERLKTSKEKLTEKPKEDYNLYL